MNTEIAKKSKIQHTWVSKYSKIFIKLSNLTVLLKILKKMEELDKCN